MISSKKEFKLYLAEDKKANMRNCGWLKYLVKVIICTEDYMAYNLCKLLRKYEYAKNCLPNSNPFYILYKGYRRYMYERKCKKYNIYIVPNTVGYGLTITHIMGGGAIIVPQKVGNYFSIRQFTTVGKGNGDACPIIGNNVILGANVVIIGDVIIGDNCIIGAGSVVVKSIPANSIVVGNPGRIVGKKIPGKVY